MWEGLSQTKRQETRQSYNHREVSLPRFVWEVELQLIHRGFHRLCMSSNTAGGSQNRTRIQRMGREAEFFRIGPPNQRREESLEVRQRDRYRKGLSNAIGETA